MWKFFAVLTGVIWIIFGILWLTTEFWVAGNIGCLALFWTIGTLIMRVVDI